MTVEITREFMLTICRPQILSNLEYNTDSGEEHSRQKFKMFCMLLPSVLLILFEHTKSMQSYLMNGHIIFWSII